MLAIYLPAVPRIARQHGLYNLEISNVSELNLFDLHASHEQMRSRIFEYLLDVPGSGHGPMVLSGLLAQICGEIARLKSEVDALREARDLNEALTFLRVNLDAATEPPVSGTAPSSVRLTASEAWDPADGFYHLEWTNLGEPYRWVGPSASFRFIAPVDRSTTLVATLKILFVREDVPLRVACRVDGRLQPTVIEQAEAGWLAHVLVPPLAGRSHVVLDFVGPPTAPATPPDDRIISMAVSSVAIAPATASDLSRFDAQANSSEPHPENANG